MNPAIEIVHEDAARSEPVAHCPSCGAQAHDKYCARCGEAITAHSPSAAEFVHEFVGHYVALEGKLWRTLRLLVTRPGCLTSDYLRGRRVPYIDPLRLYLTLSLILFAMIKLVGVSVPQLSLDETAVTMRYTHALHHPERPGEPAHVTVYAHLFVTDDAEHSLIPAALDWLGRLKASWGDNGRRFMDAPLADRTALLNQGFQAYLPYMLIGALPLFALYLKLLYWRSGRHYGEHLVFALHVTSFAFLLAVAMMAIPGNAAWLFAMIHVQKLSMVSVWDCLQLLPLAWIVAYLPAALRHVYGGSRSAAWGKALVLMGVHLLVIMGLIAAAETMAILTQA